MTEVITRVAGDDSMMALEGTARCAVLPSTDNMSRLSSINILFAGPCFPGQKKKKRKDPEKCQSIVSFSVFNFQKLGLAEAGGC